MNKRVSTIISGPLQTERMSNGKRKLLRELQIQIGDDTFNIEEGFITDYSSIPWFGRFVVRWSKVDIAGVIHDWLYVNGILNRPEADEVWKVTAKSGSHRANAAQAWICWFSIRLGGLRAWNRYRKQDAEETAISGA